MRLTQTGTTLLSVLLCVALTACGFHLRETTELPAHYQTIRLEGMSLDRGFGRILKDTFTDARSQLVSSGETQTQLLISNLDEGRRVASYAADLSVRQYMLYLVFDYSVVVAGKKVATHRIKLDKTMNYDSNFVLGKQQERSQIRRALREDAARLILLRIKSLPQ